MSYCLAMLSIFHRRARRIERGEKMVAKKKPKQVKNKQAVARHAVAKAKKAFPSQKSKAIAHCKYHKDEPTKPKVEDASESEATTVRKAHEDAKRMLDHVINDCLKDAKEKPTKALTQYLGINGTTEEDKKNIDKLTKKFKKMRKEMDKIGYEVEQEQIKSGEPYTVAYVYVLPIVKGVGDVHVNFPAFANGSDESRAATIVHEMSHYAAGTDDHAYVWQTDKWDKLSQAQKLDNADSLSSFAWNC